MPRPGSLFIAKVRRSVRVRDMEDIFERYGPLSRCEIKYGAEMAYGFVDYDDRRDADDAMRGENGRELHGQAIVIEWAKSTPRRSVSDGYRGGGRDDRDRYDDRDRGRRRRSPPRRRRSRSRSRDRGHRRSYSRSLSRSPKRHRSDYDDDRRDDYDSRRSADRRADDFKDEPREERRDAPDADRKDASPHENGRSRSRDRD